jgi:hypothetical protein
MLSAVMKGNAATFNSFNDAGRSTPILSDRRRVLGGIAASCAGLAGTAIVSFNPQPPSPAAADAALHEPQAPGGRSKVCGLGRTDSGRDQCRDDPRIQAKRRLYLQGCSLRRIYFRCKPLHAANETGALERNSQRTAVRSGVSKPGFRSLRHRWEESREYGRRRALTEMEDLTNVP